MTQENIPYESIDKIDSMLQEKLQLYNDSRYFKTKSEIWFIIH